MGVWVNPTPIVAAGDATSGYLHTLEDGIIQQSGGTPSTGDILDYCQLVQTTAQTGLAASTFVAATFDSLAGEIRDASNAHSITVTNTRVYPKILGDVLVGGMGSFAGSASGVRRIVEVRLNGVAVAGSQTALPTSGIANGISVPLPPELIVPMNGTTDYLEIMLWADYANWATVVSGSAATRLTVRSVHR